MQAGPGMIILLIIAFWLKATNSELHGYYSRGAALHPNTMTAGAVFFFAMIFAGGLIWVMIKEKRDKKSDKDNYGDYPKY